MNIIYPINEKVDQFLVDVRDGYNFPNLKTFNDLTDKIIYVPKSILPNNIKSENRKKAILGCIKGYLHELLSKNYKSFGYLKKFDEAFKNSLMESELNLILLNDDGVKVPAEFSCSGYHYLQNVIVKIEKVPFADDNLVIEIDSCIPTQIAVLEKIMQR